MDTDSFLVYIKIEGIYADIAKDVEAIFNTTNYELDRPLPKGKNKTGFDLMKDELGGKVMNALTAKIYSYLTDINDRGKKIKGKKSKKNNLTLKIIKTVLKATHLGNKINQLQKYKANTGIPRKKNAKNQ